MNKRATKVLIVRDPPPPFGGVRVSAAQTAEFLRKLGGIEYVESKFDSHPGSLAVALTDYLRRLIRVDGVLFQIGDFLSITRPRTVAFLILAKIFAKPVIYRGFAGGLQQAFETQRPWRRSVSVWLARLFTVMTFQTKADVAYFSPLLGSSVQVYWLPNTRETTDSLPHAGSVATRFCYFGKVCRAKGVHLIAEASSGMPDAISTDVYGELAAGEEGRNLQFAMTRTGVNYKGTIPSQEIPKSLRRYDCLLLPTTWKTEGYPGVVLEAFAAGIPVIVTQWNALPELVDETCGILIRPNSSKELREAMLVMHHDSATWHQMRRGALKRIADFDPNRWAQELRGWIATAISGQLAATEPAVDGVKKGI